ncbi:unnamed protein product, partial [Brassica oleracea]
MCGFSSQFDRFEGGGVSLVVSSCICDNLRSLDLVREIF